MINNVVLYIIVFILVVLYVWCIILMKKIENLKSLIDVSNKEIEKNETKIIMLLNGDSITSKSINNIWKAIDILDKNKINK